MIYQRETKEARIYDVELDRETQVRWQKKIKLLGIPIVKLSWNFDGDVINNGKKPTGFKPTSCEK